MSSFLLYQLAHETLPIAGVQHRLTNSVIMMEFEINKLIIRMMINLFRVKTLLRRCAGDAADPMGAASSHQFGMMMEFEIN